MQAGRKDVWLVHLPGVEGEGDGRRAVGRHGTGEGGSGQPGGQRTPLKTIVIVDGVVVLGVVQLYSHLRIDRRVIRLVEDEPGATAPAIQCIPGVCIRVIYFGDPCFLTP